MSERTTIGGTVYETVGSSSSNLLLKCNGIARIQWGNKLIDLIKNGKIVSEGGSAQVHVISDESEIKSDGIYVLDTNETLQLWICEGGDHYNLTGTDLYISANNKQEITGEQKAQALSNIGMYYNTLDDVKSAGIQNGLVYVLENDTLYTVKDGVIAEFEAKLKTVTVEEENEQGEVINSSFQIVLSVLDEEYLVLKDRRITVNQDIHVKNHAKLGSENADKYTGYRLYFESGKSCLDVDKINVRDGISQESYKEVTFDELISLMNSSDLEPHNWYVIKNYQNPWKLVKDNSAFNRPLLIKALNESSLCSEGMLFNDPSISIKYDPNYEESIIQGDTSVISRGKIVWMKDSDGNEANFDFLDYTDSEGNPLATLHSTENNLHQSIFPKGSYKNKLIVNNLKGTVFVDGVIDDSNTYAIDFQFDDTSSERMVMHDNTINCFDITLTPECDNFYNNKIEVVTNLSVTTNITNSTFGEVVNCVINSNLNMVKFKNLYDCTFNLGTISNVTCYSDISNYTASPDNDVLLYDITKHKNAYFEDSVLHVFCDREHYFQRGMIMMHSGFETPPEGWAVCDGGTYTYNGVTSTTPNLVDKFIKAVSAVSNVGEVLNPDLTSSNEFILTKGHLPKHEHPHQEHTHNISELSVNVDNSGELEMSFNNSYVQELESVGGNFITEVTGEGVTTSASEAVTIINTESSSGSTSGGDHTHTLTTSGGELSPSVSVELEQSWENKAFKIEPNYYSLIFIMKL